MNISSRPWQTPPLSEVQRRELATRWLRSVGADVTTTRVNKLAPVVLLFHPDSDRGRIATGLVRSGVVPTAEAVEAVYARQHPTATRSRGEKSSSPTPPAVAFTRPATTSAPQAAAQPTEDSPTREDRSTRQDHKRTTGEVSRRPTKKNTGWDPAAHGGRTREQQAALAGQRARRQGRREEDFRRGVRSVLDAQTIAAVQEFVAGVRAATGEGPTWRQVCKEFGWRRCQGSHVLIPAMASAGILTHTQQARSLAVGSRNSFPEGWSMEDVPAPCMEIALRHPPRPDPDASAQNTVHEDPSIK